MAKPITPGHLNMVANLIEEHGIAGMMEMVKAVLTTRWDNTQRSIPGTTDEEMGKNYPYRIAPVDNLAHALRTERNRLLGLESKPLPYEALLAQFKEVLQDQNDAAQYLEPDTQKISRRIYNEGITALRACQGQPLAGLDIWDGDAEEEEDTDEDD